MTLGEAQRKFTYDIGKLIAYAYDEMGYELSGGDWYRAPSVHGDQGQKLVQYGEAWSAHKYRLAVDFNLFINGEYQTSTEAHRELGEYWESLDEDNVWGGNFDDGNHYSRMYNGIA